MLLVIVRNSPPSIKKNFNMNPRLSGYIFILGLVFYVLVENLQFVSACLDIESSYKCQSLLSGEFSRWRRFVIF